ncbi:MAG: ankyrin repeat domain-containing protein [Planctomycetaceae bacterium]|nr:ankyrin repeat domain-containing protein [Planctomycetaceae bacterium]
MNFFGRLVLLCAAICAVLNLSGCRGCSDQAKAPDKFYTPLPQTPKTDVIQIIRESPQGRLDLSRLSQLVSTPDFDIEGGERGKKDGTPLYWAARTNNPEAVVLLMQKGADIHRADPVGDTPLTVAVARGHGKVAMTLLAAGAKANHPNDNGRTALHAAAAQGSLELAKALVDHGADINCQDKRGMTPLFTAANSGQIEMVEWLIEHNADPNKAAIDGMRPIRVAFLTGHNEIVQLLRSKGAKATAADFERPRERP